MWRIFCIVAFFAAQAYSASIFQSRAAMDLNLETSRRYTIASSFQAEQQISFYLSSLFNTTVDSDFKVLSINVQVKNEGVLSSTRTSLQTQVSMVYIANEPKMIANLLVERVDSAVMAKQLQVPSLSAAYDNLRPIFKLEDIPEGDDGRPKADKGLIAVTVFLSLALLMVASVMMYITGGWSACHRCCINCLFEEIEEDDYAIAKKSTFQVQSYDEEDQKSIEKPPTAKPQYPKSPEQREANYSDTASQARSEMSEDVIGLQHLPSGLLGATHHPNPAAGLGIKTPNRFNTSGYDSELSSALTPMSEITHDHGPLGITSMRKLPRPDDGSDDEVEGGLAHLILKRRFKESLTSKKM